MARNCPGSSGLVRRNNAVAAIAKLDPAIDTAVQVLATVRINIDNACVDRASVDDRSSISDFRNGLRATRSCDHRNNSKRQEERVWLFCFSLEPQGVFRVAEYIAVLNPVPPERLSCQRPTNWFERDDPAMPW